MESGQGIHCLQKQFSHFSLGISKSHSRMYLNWTSQNLTSFANFLSLVCTDFIGKIKSHRRESNAIRSPLIMKHMYFLWSFAPSIAQDWQLQVSGCMGFSLLVNRLLYKHALLFIGAIHKKKCCSLSHFAWAILV